MTFVKKSIYYNKNKMLSLDSLKWRDFDIRFGENNSITDLIKQLCNAPLPENYSDDPWFTLFDDLYHQGDIYPVAFAVVPHLIEIALETDLKKSHYILSWITVTEAHRHKKAAPKISEELKHDYSIAIKKAEILSLKLLRFEWNELDYKYLLGGLAILQGKFALGLTVQNLEKEQNCPNCNEDFAAEGYKDFDEE